VVTAREEQGSAGVAQIVEAYVVQFRFFEERLKRGRSDVAKVQKLASRDAEGKVDVLPQVAELEPFGVLCCLVRFESFYGELCEAYAAALAVLRSGEGRAGFGL
jgi:hypothetical protein